MLPSSAEYWHIGATTRRFSISRPANLIGENKRLVTGAEVMVGDPWNVAAEAGGGVNCDKLLAQFAGIRSTLALLQRHR
jgi:hypothetical protein